MSSESQLLGATAPHEVIPTGRKFVLRLGKRAVWLRVLVVLVVLQLAGGSVIGSPALLGLQMRRATADWSFDLLRWEVNALTEKARAAINDPAAGLSAIEGSSLVTAYLARARDLRQMEAQLAKTDLSVTDRALLKARHTQLHNLQESKRPVAEAVLQGQVASVLRDMGIGVAGNPWPPVLFTFTESPRKLVVSPRSRITTQQSMILNPGMPAEAMNATEAAIEASDDSVSAYVTATGGMGAFPTMVVEDASLPWILSTVAHEWVHTYLAFFPLGFNYGSSQENTTINETVADIVGDEVGQRVLERYYSDYIAQRKDDIPRAQRAEPSFNFVAEMRETRQTVDKLLKYGRVADAEHYMEIRQLLFAENGYNLRKLNQAYFAFHGSYGTSAAADVLNPDALGPRIQHLRLLLEDAPTFLRAIRSITDRVGLEELIGESDQ